MRRIQLWWLKWREWVLEAQIENGEDLMLDHQRRLRVCQEKIRRVRAHIAMIETPQTLLAQALRGRR